MNKLNLKNFSLKSVLNLISNNVIVFLVILLTIFVGISQPTFLSVSNVLSIGTFSSFKLLIALGISGTLITKGTDLSAGRIAGIAASLMIILTQDPTYAGRLITNPPGWFAAIQANPVVLVAFSIVVVVLISIILGLINGIIIAYFKVAPFIATLGMQLFVYGVHSLIVKQPVSVPVSQLNSLATGKLFGISYLILYAIIALVIFWFLYNKTRYGKYVYAIGGNEHAAEVSGINTRVTLVKIYTLAAICYAIAGIMLAARDTSSTSTMATGYELDAIAACAIGGVSFNGGIGKISGIVVGVVTFEVLRTALQFIGYGDSWTFVIQGIVIVFAVILDIRKNSKKK